MLATAELVAELAAKLNGKESAELSNEKSGLIDRLLSLKRALESTWQADVGAIDAAIFEISRLTVALAESRCRLCDGSGRRCVHESQLSEVWADCECKAGENRRLTARVASLGQELVMWTGAREHMRVRDERIQALEQQLTALTAMVESSEDRLSEVFEVQHASTFETAISFVIRQGRELRQQLAAAKAPRWKRFNDETGSLSGGSRHPDRCVCQGDEPTPHKHYDDEPHSCARCGHKECVAYRPLLWPENERLKAELQAAKADHESIALVCAKAQDEAQKCREQLAEFKSLKYVTGLVREIETAKQMLDPSNKHQDLDDAVRNYMQWAITEHENAETADGLLIQYEDIAEWVRVHPGSLVAGLQESLNENAILREKLRMAGEALEIREMPKWFEYIRVRERRLLGTKLAPDFLISFGPQNICKPETTNEKMEARIQGVKEWILLMMRNESREKLAQLRDAEAGASAQRDSRDQDAQKPTE